MSKIATKVVLLKEDYDILTTSFSTSKRVKTKTLENCRRLFREIGKAILLEKDQFPSDVVRLNSTVIVKDMDTNQVTTYTIVLPEKANIRQSKVSILSPIGIALIGFKKGLRFTWKFLSSKHKLSILEVYNSPSLNQSK
jgi:regulator of nucleoside diphosphate kinase